MSAAGSVILALVLIVLGMIGLPVVGVLAWVGLANWREWRKLERAKQQAEIYAALNGTQPRSATSPRRADSSAAAPIIIVGGREMYQ